MEIEKVVEIIQDNIQTGLQLVTEVVKGVISTVYSKPTLPGKRLDGQVGIVTGATSGIGKETARELAKRGAKVIIGCRDKVRGEATAKELAKEGGKVVFMKLDLASFKSVEEFCKRVVREETSLDFLINNAGMFTLDKIMTEDGYESQFQVNHLSHFLLTNILLDLIKAQDGGRIINVSSVAHWASIGIPTDINWEMVRYNGVLAYANSKLANVLFSKRLEEKLSDTGVSVYSVHPGGVSTDLGRNLPSFLPDQVHGALTTAFNWVAKSPEDGAMTSLFCVLAPNLPSGYYDDMKLGWTNPLTRNKNAISSLWALSENLTGLDN